MNLDQLGYPGRAGAGLKGKNGAIRTRAIGEDLVRRYQVSIRCIWYQGIRYQGRKERWDRTERMAGEGLVRARAKDEDELANSCYFGRHDRRGQRRPQTARLDGGS